MFAYLKNRLAIHWLKRHNVKLSNGVSTIPKGGELTLEEGSAINVKIMQFQSLKIGAMTYIRSGSELLNVQEIGRFCSISNNVVIGQPKGGSGHSLSGVSTNPFQLLSAVAKSNYNPPPATQIGHDVWIGRDVMIMEGVSIGTGAVIAARSVVTRNVPEYAIVAGIPARQIGFRHTPKIANQLLESRWWEKPTHALKTLPMDDPESFLEHVSAFESTSYAQYSLTRHSWQRSHSDFPHL